MVCTYMALFVAGQKPSQEELGNRTTNLANNGRPALPIELLLKIMQFVKKTVINTLIYNLQYVDVEKEVIPKLLNM